MNHLARPGPFDAAFRCYVGSYWHTIRSACARYILDYAEQNPDVVRYFRGVLIPDKSFFQTVLVNSRRFNLVNDNLRYVDFRGSRHGHPKSLDLDDLPALVMSGAFFARKFDWPRSAPVLDALKAAGHWAEFAHARHNLRLSLAFASIQARRADQNGRAQRGGEVLGFLRRFRPPSPRRFSRRSLPFSVPGAAQVDEPTGVELRRIDGDATFTAPKAFRRGCGRPGYAASAGGARVVRMIEDADAETCGSSTASRPCTTGSAPCPPRRTRPAGRNGATTICPPSTLCRSP